MVGDLIPIGHIRRDTTLVVMSEKYGVSTCKVITDFTNIAKGGDFYINIELPPYDYFPVRLVLGDFTLDAYTSALGPGLPVPLDEDNFRILSGVYEPARLGRAYRNPARIAARNEFTSTLWETFCVPVIKGGVIYGDR